MIFRRERQPVELHDCSGQCGRFFKQVMALEREVELLQRFVRNAEGTGTGPNSQRRQSGRMSAEEIGTYEHAMWAIGPRHPQRKRRTS